MFNKIVIFFGLILFLFPVQTFGDMSPYAIKGVNYCFRISNIKDYPEYVFLQYSKKSVQRCQDCNWSGGHFIINIDDCVTSKDKEDSSTVYAIGKENFKEFEISSEIKEEEKYFETNNNLIYSGIIINPVYFVDVTFEGYKKSKTVKIIDVLEITNLDSNNFELKKIGRVYGQSDGREKSFDSFLYNVVEESIFYEKEPLLNKINNLVSPRALLNYWYIIPLLAVLGMIAIFLLRRHRV